LLVVGVLATRVWLADMSGSGAWVAVVADVHQETKGAYRRLLHFLAEKDDRHVARAGLCHRSSIHSEKSDCVLL
jgi:hypothetical protein